tara:strand:+ start:355 stop:792 length:438 start_codon:yes stop_codon:yes gene_type:complete
MADTRGAGVDGLNKFLRDMSKAPKALQNELRDRAKVIAEPIAADARANATTAQQKLVTPSIRAVRDRVPVVKLGGGRKAASTTPRKLKPKMSDIYWGADFGSDHLKQFPGEKKGGRLIFPAIKGRSDEIADQYFEAIEDVFKGRF